MELLKDKVAIITGGSSGIGRASAILFAKGKAKVVVVCRTAKNGKETTKIIKDNGDEAMFVQADVLKAPEVEHMVEETIKKYGKIDVLFNNAGAQAPNRSVTETTEEEWDRVINTNLKGIFLCSKYTIPKMIENRGGSIINVSSDLGLVADKGYAAYCASKGGVIMLTKSMAIDYAPYNILVNCLCPANISTPMFDYCIAAFDNPEERRKKLTQTIPLGRVGKPEEIANVALFLASDLSSYITGAIIVADGGRTAT